MSTINFDKYEAVIGLEVHTQLQTNSKAYCTDGTLFGLSPNEQISPVSLGHPGTLPVVNEEVIKYAIKMGIATNCTINHLNQYARKNYFYADLPKGYQITQSDTPICTNGSVKLNVNGVEKIIGITRIHMEEDAGKSIHDIDPFNSLIDLNRAGVPLIEIVTEPDFRNADEVYEYLVLIRKIVRYLEICDGNMEEGSLRCDCNISVRLKGTTAFGTKVEVKNMNSIRNVKRAIEYEIVRQITALESGEKLYQQTRSFDAAKGTTFDMRSKELANDYRYFTEPDLPPVLLTDSFIDSIKADMPALPDEMAKQFIEEYKLSKYDAQVLSEEKDTAHFYIDLCKLNSNYKACANWVMVTIKSYLNEKAISINEFPVSKEAIAAIIKLIDEGKLSNTNATSKIFPQLIQNPNKPPQQIAEELNLIQENNDDLIISFANDVIAKYPDKVSAYKAGKIGLLGMFVGEVMKMSKGKADPKKANEIIEKLLNA